MYPIIQLPLIPGWQSHQETLLDGEIELAHLETYLSDDNTQSDKALIDVYAGAMPQGSSAEQEALNSYQDIVGDDEEDPGGDRRGSPHDLALPGEGRLRI